MAADLTRTTHAGAEADAPETRAEAETSLVEDAEARATLLDFARRKTGRIPEAVFVDHVLSITRGADWPVRRSAFDALIRRFAAVKRDEIEILVRPKRGVPLGLYRTRSAARSKNAAAAYVTSLEQLTPPKGSCDCPDFSRSSLGLCKHLLRVLDEIYADPKRSTARRSQMVAQPTVLLSWDPIRPWRGEGDWLARVSAHGDLGRARKIFQPGPDKTLVLRALFAGDPIRRRALVEQLSRLPCDAALARLLETESSRLERIAEDAHLSKDLPRLLKTLKRKLYAYQVESVSRFLSTSKLLLADDMGLGKTVQAVAACHVLWRSGRIKKGLVITPASLKPQWLREWEATSDAPIRVVDGSPDERRSLLRKTKEGFLIVNYEQVIRDLDAMETFAADILIIDEAQRVKNWATKTALSVKRLDAPYRLVLTGTPMENRLEELASILDLVDDRALEPKWRLVPWHTTITANADRNGTPGARNLDTLRARLAPCMIRRLRQDVLKQLPPRTDTRVPVEMSAEQLEEHEALGPAIARIVATRKKRPLTHAEFLRLMQLLTTQRIISNGLAQLHFEEVWPSLARASKPTPSLLAGLFSPKLIELRELVRSLVVEQSRKIVVFSQWRRMLRLAHWAISDILDDSGSRAAFFTGAEAPKQRTRNIVDFHDDPRTRVLFLTDAGGVGLNLQRAASACINLELPWNPAVLEQRISRIHRLGQDLPIDVYNLITEKGIESRILATVGTKRALFKGLFDGTNDEIRFDQAASFFERIEEIIDQEPARISAVSSDECEDDDLAVGDDVESAADTDAPQGLSAPAADLRSLFAKVLVRTNDRGGITLEAPAEEAATLAGMLEGFAALLRTAAQQPER
jgi:hypothetical protein